jgi:adenylate kinase family enzyme
MGLRINFYGGPGVGKSTLAALLYGWLRQQRFNAELAQEWIKTWVYQGKQMESFDYVYTFAKQLHTEDGLLRAGVNIVVTDSPIYLQCMYALHQKMKAANELWRIAKRFEETYPSVNFLVDRGEFAVYEQTGRNETLDQAMEMDRFIETCLRDWHVPFTHVRTGTLDPVIAELDKQFAILRSSDRLSQPETPAPKKRQRSKKSAAEIEDRRIVLQALTDLGVEHGFNFFGLDHVVGRVQDNGTMPSRDVRAILDELHEKGEVHRTPGDEREDPAYAIDYTLAPRFME